MQFNPLLSGFGGQAQAGICWMVGCPLVGLPFIVDICLFAGSFTCPYEGPFAHLMSGFNLAHLCPRWAAQGGIQHTSLTPSFVHSLTHSRTRTHAVAHSLTHEMIRRKNQSKHVACVKGSGASMQAKLLCDRKVSIGERLIRSRSLVC